MLAFRRLRPLFLTIVVGLVLLEVLALTPSPLDEPASSDNPPPVPAEELYSDSRQPSLATGIPVGKIPEYTIDSFEYASVSGGVKQWQLRADRAFFYQKDRVVHSRKVTTFLYNADGSIVTVVGDEAKYLMNGKDLELFGHVSANFPDGFEMKSEYLQYRPEHRHLYVPKQYLVEGTAAEKNSQRLEFTSRGVDYPMAENEVTLPESAHIVMLKRSDASPGVPEKTMIDSDRCVLMRKEQIAHFTMDSWRPLAERFVKIEQPGLFARSRKAELHYGDFSQLVHYLDADIDVLIREIPDPAKEKKKSETARSAGPTPGPSASPKPPQLRYATAGHAEFDIHKDTIRLEKFPQVYQGDDTATGEVITVHRESDLIEVDESNAYSSGGDQ